MANQRVLLRVVQTRLRSDDGRATETASSNKGMKLTKLSAAWLRGRTCRLMPAQAKLDAGTASQLIPGVGQLVPGIRRGWDAREGRRNGGDIATDLTRRPGARHPVARPGLAVRSVLFLLVVANVAS
jgi:hypothetical protein